MTVPAKKAAKRLPLNYVQAKTAVAACVRVDECKDWADKAVALAAYARQMRDTKLLDDARRIQDRAIKRGGVLLKQVKAKKGGDPKKLRGTTVPNSRSAAASSAGLSPDQAKQMLRVANVPDGQFEALVEGPRPPSPKKLAELGTKKQERPKPEPFRNEYIDWTAAVRHIAALPACGLEVLAKRDPFAFEYLRDDAIKAFANLTLWCALFGETK